MDQMLGGIYEDLKKDEFSSSTEEIRYHSDEDKIPERKVNWHRAQNLSKVAKNANGKRMAECLEDDAGDSFDAESPEEEEKRLKANHQERNRMQRFNTALNNLRGCIPDHFRLGSRRLSKIRTLRLAINYIAALQDILKTDPKPRCHEQTCEQYPAMYSYDPSNQHGVEGTPIMETPSRIGLRDIAERGLSASYSYSPVFQTPTGVNSFLTGVPSVALHSDSSDESFCTEQRAYGDSPDNLAASAYLGDRLYSSLPSVCEQPSHSEVTGLQQSMQFYNPYSLQDAASFNSLVKKRDTQEQLNSPYYFGNASFKNSDYKF